MQREAEETAYEPDTRPVYEDRDPAVEALESRYFDIASQFDRLGYPHRVVIADDITTATKADLVRVPDDARYPGPEVHRWGLHAWDFGHGGAEVLITMDAKGEPSVRQIDGPEHVVDTAVHSALKLARRAINPPPKPQQKFNEIEHLLRQRNASQVPMVFPSSWDDMPVPEREWWLPDLIPSRTVTLLSGDGGVGKSLLALQLGAASAMGMGTAGLTPSSGRVLYLGAEDEADEFHRRLVDICRGAGRTLADLGDRFGLLPMAGRDAILTQQPPGSSKQLPTEVWNNVLKRAAQIVPDILILDTSADLFGGNEIDRAQVRQFVGMLRGFAQDYDCAVLLLSHPSVAGMQSGSGLSGSTAWNNSVRSRLYLDFAPAEDGGEPDRCARRLSTKKSNYGAPEGTISLRWDAGRFVPDDGSAPAGAALVEKHAEEVFLSVLEKMTRQGQSLSPKPSPSYAPRMISKHPDAKGLNQKRLVAVMQRLLDGGAIQIIEEGPPSRRYSRVLPTSMIHRGGGSNSPSN
ncbi:AAA family ATPase [Labrys sp. LIt4]|uniref:AAA family ATPase n=1 Tax=Labrys sp. LIt4 TaxID=2821355 RepID=UPI001AE06F80|nr:AAA family ATPase [Labrys sp. LIt4]MBP0579000.1 AAA family ATPase [Labrys sp. LIt4]